MEQACFELSIPLKAEYVSIARLTVSGIANRAGFDFDAIEDIKVALAEVCNRLIQNRLSAAEGPEDSNCRMQFILSEHDITINFLVDRSEDWDFFAANEEQDELSKIGLSLLSLLMDEFHDGKGENGIISMKKYLDLGE